MRVTGHAIDRYRIFYPDAEREDLLRELSMAEEIDYRTAEGLLGRAGHRNTTVPSQYFLHRERTGLFVVDDEVIISFLRFYSDQQQDLAKRLWPIRDDTPSVVR